MDPADALWLWSLQQEHDRRFAEFLMSYERRAVLKGTVATICSPLAKINVLLTRMCGPLVELVELLLLHAHSLRTSLEAPGLLRGKCKRAAELLLGLEQARSRAERAVAELEPAAAEWIRTVLGGLVALAHSDSLRLWHPNQGVDLFLQKDTQERVIVSRDVHLGATEQRRQVLEAVRAPPPRGRSLSTSLCEAPAPAETSSRRSSLRDQNSASHASASWRTCSGRWPTRSARWPP
jgi:hypothetical protein